MSRNTKIPIGTHPALFIQVDEHIWAKYLRLGFSERFSLDRNGGRHRYARTMAYLPDPSLRSVPIALARLFVVIHTRTSGKPIANKGWTVRYRNGDALDLRLENLEVVKARKHRNSIYAAWTVNDRFKILAQGGDPKKEIAERRRLWRGAHTKENARTTDKKIPPAPHRGSKP